MQTLRRIAAVLTFPAIAYLGAACERTDMPTQARPKVLAQFSQPVDLVVDDDGFASTTDCNALTPTFPTINLAIMAASPGQKIGVCPGFYNEMVMINKNDLTLLGAKSGVDARTRVFVPTDESIINNACGRLVPESTGNHHPHAVRSRRHVRERDPVGLGELARTSASERRPLSEGTGERRLQRAVHVLGQEQLVQPGLPGRRLCDRD